MKNALLFFSANLQEYFYAITSSPGTSGKHLLFIAKKAQAEHRSLAQEAVNVLATGLNVSTSHKSRRKQLLQSIEENHCGHAAIKQIDSVELIRDDQQR